RVTVNRGAMRLTKRVVRLGTVGLAAASVILGGVATAAVTQPPPGNEPMPQASPATEISIATARGFPTSALSLATLFANFNGGADAAIDPAASAQITPGSLTPQCGLAASVVLRGGGCRVAIGWYNATEPATKPAVVYPIVSTGDLRLAPPSGIGCYDSDFCPLATRTTTQAPL